MKYSLGGVVCETVFISWAKARPRRPILSAKLPFRLGKRDV